jgi:hypothetical protein
MSNSKILLLDTAKISETQSTIRARNSYLISNELNCGLAYDNNTFFNFVDKGVDTIVINGASFNPSASLIGNYIKQNKSIRIVYLNNDYLWGTAGTYAKLYKTHHTTVISSVPQEISKLKNCNDYHFLNLNCLIAKEPNIDIVKKYDVVYYGTWRKDRHRSMVQYFVDGSFYISSSKKNLRKFHQLGGYNAKWCDKLSWRIGFESLNLFRYSLYLEDKKSTETFTNLANRFYESMFCNTVQFFDISCKGTVEKSGLYEIGDIFYVKNNNEIKAIIENFQFLDLLKLQSSWSEIAIKEKQSVLASIKNILL